MGSLLGFRGPHFSEEEAWLPGWLQQHEGKSFGEAIGDGQSCFEKRIEELQILRGNSNAGISTSMLSGKEGGYKSFRLFLSGESSSLLSSAPSSEDVLNLHLHLSTDGSSQNRQSPTVETSERERHLSNQSLEASIAPESEQNKCNAHQNAGISIMTPALRCQGPDIESEWKSHTETVVLPEAVEISSAVELSIAASEAMVIHEEIRTMSLSKSLSPSSVLEVALQLKEARLEVWQASNQCSTEQSDEDDALSDLDDLNMMDAYDDVGLSFTDVADMDNQGFDLSQPKGFTASEDNVVPETACSKPDEFLNQKFEDVLVSNIHMKKGSVLESCDGGRLNTVTKDPVLASDANSLASHDDMIVYQHLKSLDVSASIENVSFAVRREDMSQAATSSPVINSSEDAGKGREVLSIVPDRFQSRWIGGWTRKDIKSSAPAEHNDKSIHIPFISKTSFVSESAEHFSMKEVKSSAPAEHNDKSIPKPFIRETSFLSESADIAPDENSVVQKQDKGTILASQSSLPSQNFQTKANDGILFTQDVMNSPSLSPFDTLCSHVPCSISSENGCATSVLNHDDEVLTRGCVNPITQNAMENVQRSSDSDNLLLNGKELIVPDSMEGLHPAVHRKYTSLRSYSMLLRGQGTSIEKEGYCDKPLPAGSFAKSNLLVTQTTVTHWRDEQGNCDGTAKDGSDFPVDTQNMKTSPLILNRRTRHCLQASDVLIHELDGNEVLKLTAVPGKDKELSSSEKTHEVQSKCDAQTVTPVRPRKRVRFSETEAIITLKDKVQEQPAFRPCDNRRAGKKVRRCNPHSDSSAQELKRHPKLCHEQHSKRLLFLNMEFLLTGYSRQKEKEIENLIKRYGGSVLSDIPNPPTARVKMNSRLKSKALPIVLCPKKKQTIKFLYGCAVHAHVLKVNWLADSITAGSMLPPQKYTILRKYVGRRHSGIKKPVNYDGHPPIFDGLGIMLLGKSIYCTGMAKVVKHGGGQVFKTLQWLVQSLDTKKISTGVIVADDESKISRHLKQCALEQSIPVVPAYWIIRSLHRGRLLPLKKNKTSTPVPPIKPPDCPDSIELSMEI